MTGKRKGAGGKLFEGKDEKETLSKLKEAFSIGAGDEEAALYAEISVEALSRYQKRHPGFCREKAMLRKKPTLKARQTVVRNLEDKGLAFKYLVLSAQEQSLRSRGSEEMQDEPGRKPSRKKLNKFSKN